MIINFTDIVNLTWKEDKTRKIEYLNFKQVQQLKELLLKNIEPTYTSSYMLLIIIYTDIYPVEIRVLT